MSSDYQVDFNNCHIGIKNAGNICRVEDRLNMAIEKLTDKVEEIQEDVISLQTSVNNRFDKVDKKFEDLETKLEDQILNINKTMPSKIDERIELNTQKKKAFSVDKVMALILGIFSTVCGGIALALVKTMMSL